LLLARTNLVEIGFGAVAGTVVVFTATTGVEAVKAGVTSAAVAESAAAVDSVAVVYTAAADSGGGFY
jgi:hypothetical protein